MITNQEIRDKIEADFEGEERMELLVGMRFHALPKNELRHFISHMTRKPRSGGHQKVKARVLSSMLSYERYLKGLREG